MKKKQLKAIIIGGGIGGPALALFLKKAGIAAEVYEGRSTNEGIGGGLGLAPNGLNVLAHLNLHEKVIAAGTIIENCYFKNAKGRRLAKFRYSLRKYRQPGVSLSRQSLNQILTEELALQGIPIFYRKKLKGVVERNDQVTVSFEDGSTATGDFLVGADGVGSRVRNYILPAGPNPTFSGMVCSAGFVDIERVKGITPVHVNSLNFIYGQQGFFGFGGADKGKIMWWTNVMADHPFTKENIMLVNQDQERQSLFNTYGQFAKPVPQLIQETEQIIRINVLDIMSLPAWSKNNIVLIGDAAHAVSPNSGQGASMALEDAMLLARLLRDEPLLRTAFLKFEEMRKPRAEKIVEEGRRRGEDKAVTSPFKQCIRELMIRIFVNLFAEKGNEWLFSYRIDWD